MTDKIDLAQTFRQLLIAYVGLAEDDPDRPTWEEVNAAQNEFIDSIPGMRDKIVREIWQT